MDTPIPDGFAPYTRPSPLIDPWRPLYMREDADRTILGLALREAHCNSRGTAHGGLIAALSDQAMGISCGVQLRAQGRAVINLWTTSLSVDYLGAGTIGQWITFDTYFARVGQTLCHAELEVAADGAAIARARAAFRVVLDKG
ncbi:MAG: thioesterase [Alphaproteobacteria bacterium]|nr:thioesterase [Alphaproteobacteria bacterium]